MAGGRLGQRIAALESSTPAIERWHWLVQELGETSDEAKSRYEAANGPIAEGEGIIRFKMAAVPCRG
jgi:hypothetical protein